MSEFATATSDEFDGDQRAYRSVEPWAVIALLLSLLSPAALLGSLMWFFPALALVASLIALGRLRSDPQRTGRPAALVALALSLGFGIVPAAQYGASWFILSRQAREVADQFFTYLRDDSPEKALMLRFDPDQRQPFDELLWTFYRADAEARGELQTFVEDPVVRTLLALGDRANVRFYKTSAVASEGTRGVVNYLYTVTVPNSALVPAGGAGKKHVDSGGDRAGKSDKASSGKTTFFVSVGMERNQTRKEGINPWRVLGVQGGVDPDNLGAKSK